jgi:hypothetical protein
LRKVSRGKNGFYAQESRLNIEFLYGDVILAEVQLCVDTFSFDYQANETNKLNDYFYELERGLFGHTTELMM